MPTLRGIRKTPSCIRFFSGIWNRFWQIGGGKSGRLPALSNVSCARSSNVEFSRMAFSACAAIRAEPEGSGTGGIHRLACGPGAQAPGPYCWLLWRACTACPMAICHCAIQRRGIGARFSSCQNGGSGRTGTRHRPGNPATKAAELPVVGTAGAHVLTGCTGMRSMRRPAPRPGRDLSTRKCTSDSRLSGASLSSSTHCSSRPPRRFVFRLCVAEARKIQRCAEVCLPLRFTLLFSWRARVKSTPGAASTGSFPGN